MPTNYFLDMISTLRKEEEVILFEQLLQVDTFEKESVMQFLKEEYLAESSHYPFKVPEFHPEAALWAALTSYIGAQLILFRQNLPDEIEPLFPVATFQPTPATILSVDLCLRFLPAMTEQLNLIDTEDLLIDILEKRLHIWHYSGIAHSLAAETLDLSVVHSDPCVQQLYLNRITQYKNIELAKLPSISPLLRANMGIYQDEFWNELKLQTIDE